MPDELRHCFAGCCHFVSNQSVAQSDYELAVQKNQPNLNLPGPVETLISCRNAGGLQETVEASVGFYLGTGLRRAYGTLIPDASNPSVFDKITGNFRREATDEDLHEWREAWSKSVKNAKK